MSRETPRTFALRFRIWQYCAPREWDVTVLEIADALGESYQRISATVHNAGWDGRLRSASATYGFYGANPRVDSRDASECLARDVVSGHVEAGAL